MCFQQYLFSEKKYHPIGILALGNLLFEGDLLWEEKKHSLVNA